MTSEEIVRQLAGHRRELDAISVRELLLFGSHARNEASSESDLDFVVEFHRKSFDHYMGLVVSAPGRSRHQERHQAPAARAHPARGHSRRVRPASIFGVDLDIVWEVATIKLPVVGDAVQRFVDSGTR